MKALNTLTIAALTITTAQANAGMLCEARIPSGPNGRESVVLEREAIAEGQSRYEGNVGGMTVQINEMASKDQSNPTLFVSVKNSSGLNLQTMMPAPGPASGNPFVRTDLSTGDGTLTIKCIAK